MTADRHEYYMDLALNEGRRAEAAGEVPVGAVVVDAQGDVIGRGCNQPISTVDPTAHAEIAAIREACRTVGNYRLTGATLYCTIEPCVMCAGAIVHARIACVAFGAPDPKAGAAGSLYNVLTDPRLNHSVEVIRGVCGNQCSSILQEFFRNRRIKRIQYGSDALEFAELRLPEGSGPHAVAVVIHGGFWRSAYNLDHLRSLCAALNDSGIATWSLEYRRIGNQGGGYPGALDDVRAGANHLRKVSAKYGLDLNRVVAIGHSAGAQLALWLAAQPGVQRMRGVISLAGVVDLRRAYEFKLSNTAVAEFLGGSPESVPDRYRRSSPIELLPLHIPQRVIHGTLDADVPFEISKAYVDAATSAGDDAALIPLEGAGHFEPIDPRTKEFETVRQVVLDLLK